MKEQNKGVKLDNGKLPIANFLLDFKEEIEELCKIYDFGCNKYGRGNFQLVENGKDRFLNALVRHLLKKGVDDETGISHKAHVAYNALMVLWFENKEKEQEQ